MSEPVDHKHRAMIFHRRAQRAEADLAKAASQAAYWNAAFRDLIANRNTVKRQRNRARAALRDARMQALSPIDRIIQLGRQFP